MYVCVCHGVTDHQIRRAVDEGASSLRQVRAKLTMGHCCGRCLKSARDVITEHKGGSASQAHLQAIPASCLSPAG